MPGWLSAKLATGGSAEMDASGVFWGACWILVLSCWSSAQLQRCGSGWALLAGRWALWAETLHHAWPEASNPRGTQLLSPICTEFTWGLKGKSWTLCPVDVGEVVSLHISMDLSPRRGRSFSFPLLMS